MHPLRTNHTFKYRQTLMMKEREREREQMGASTDKPMMIEKEEKQR